MSKSEFHKCQPGSKARDMQRGLFRIVECEMANLEAPLPVPRAATQKNRFTARHCFIVTDGGRSGRRSLEDDIEFI